MLQDHITSPLRDDTAKHKSEQDADNTSVAAAEKAPSPLPANIPQYVVLVKDGGDDEKTHAASALFDLSASDANQDAIAGADGIPALVELLRSGSEAQKTNAAGALMNLAKNAAIQPAILATGGAHALVRTMGDGELGTFAAAALVNLAAHTPSHTAIAEADGISGLIGLTRHGSRPLQLLSAMGLSVLAKTPTVATTIYSLGGASALFLLARRGTSEQRTHANRALRRMAKAGAIDPKILASDGELQATAKAALTIRGEESRDKRTGDSVDDDGSLSKRIKTEP